MELNSLSNLLANLKNIFIGKSSIIQNTEVSDSTKVPSCAVTKNLQSQIADLNNNKANITHSHDRITFCNHDYYRHFTKYPKDYLKPNGEFNIEAVSFNGADEQYDPPTEKTDYKWYNVFTFGVLNRCTQIAVQNFLHSSTTSGYIWIRVQQDTWVSSWFCIAKPELK